MFAANREVDHIKLGMINSQLFSNRLQINVHTRSREGVAIYVTSWKVAVSAMASFTACEVKFMNQFSPVTTIG